MNKKIIAAAVAASISAVATADVSITGNANYEWFSTTTGTDGAAYSGDTEVNLSVKGKSGDTGVVLNMEFNEGHGGANLDVEDMYITTKVGDINVKAGSFGSGTTAFAGEIDSGARVTDKIDLNTSVGGWTVGYAQDEGTSGGNFNNDGSAVYATGTVGGVKVTVKESSDSYTGLGVAGSLAGINYRIENKDADAANSDVFFADVSTTVSGATVGYTVVDADAACLITEGDSGILGLSINHTDGTVSSCAAGSSDGSADTRGHSATGATQFRISAPLAGNTLSAKMGTIDDGLGTGTDLDFTELKLTRALASGATLNVVYDDYDQTATTSKEVIEIDLSVKF